MKRRKLLLLGPLSPYIGGDSVSTLNLAKSRLWGQNGYSIDTVSTAPSRGHRLEGDRYGITDVARFFRIAAGSVKRLPSSDAVLLWANAGLLCSAGPAIVKIFALYRKPYVIKLFGTSLPRRIRALGGGKKARVLSMLEKAAFLLPQTEGLADELADETGIPRERIVCFPNFVAGEAPDTKGISTTPERPASFQGRFVFAGQIKEEKGVFVILKALKGRPDLSCDFYGPLMRRDREAFMSEVEDMENARYTGIVPPGEVVDTMRDYDCLLLPSWHDGEGYPGVILQAFAAGIPVIASEFKYIPEIVEDGVRGLLVPVRSPEALLAAMERMCKDEGLREKMTANASSFLEAFSERKIVEGILINDVLGRLLGK